MTSGDTQSVFFRNSAAVHGVRAGLSAPDRSQQAGQTSYPRGRGARRQSLGRRPQPPRRSTASFPTALSSPRGAVAVRRPPSLGWEWVGETRAAFPPQPFGFLGSRTTTSSLLGTSISVCRRLQSPTSDP